MIQPKFSTIHNDYKCRNEKAEIRSKRLINRVRQIHSNWWFWMLKSCCQQIVWGRWWEREEDTGAYPIIENAKKAVSEDGMITGWGNCGNEGRDMRSKPVMRGEVWETERETGWCEEVRGRWKGLQGDGDRMPVRGRRKKVRCGGCGRQSGVNKWRGDGA